MQTHKTPINPLWIPFALLAIRFGLYPLSYLSSEFRKTSPLAAQPAELQTSLAYLTIFFVHITCAGTNLITGWTQFIEPLRHSHLEFHRFLGRINFFCVLIGSITGFIISFFAWAGIIYQSGFATLAVIWFICNLCAFTSIKQGNIKEHQKWMMRTYSLTFSAVTVRLEDPILLAFGVDEMVSQWIVAWLCWVPNLIVIETYIRSRFGKEENSKGKSESKEELIRRQ